VFGDALPGNVEMAAKLVESLAVVVVKLIEESAPVWIGQGFKDIVHSWENMQLNGCIYSERSQTHC